MLVDIVFCVFISMQKCSRRRVTLASYCTCQPPAHLPSPCDVRIEGESSASLLVQMLDAHSGYFYVNQHCLVHVVRVSVVRC